MYWLFLHGFHMSMVMMDMSWLYSNRSWRARVGKSEAYHKSGSRRREKKGV